MNTVASSAANDVPLCSAPNDSISAIAWSPVANYLAVSSWDNSVRIYEVQNGQSIQKAQYEHQAPVLCVCWNNDGTKLFSGGADKAARMFDLSSGAASQVAAHDEPIRCVKWCQPNNGQPGFLATGSWDKTVKYWSIGNSSPIGGLQVNERVYAMDVEYPYLVVGVGMKGLIAINLAVNPNALDPTIKPNPIDPSLKWQTRTIACFPACNPSSKPGFAVGSVEGRVSIQYLRDEDRKPSNNLNFSFKCHRKPIPPYTQPAPGQAQSNPPKSDKNEVHAVNAIAFHKTVGTFATAGADGAFSFWDKENKNKLKGPIETPSTIVAVGYNFDGTIFAYANSYDWARGYMGNVPNHPNKVMLHALTAEEINRKTK